MDSVENNSHVLLRAIIKKYFDFGKRYFLSYGNNVRINIMPAGICGPAVVRRPPVFTPWNESQFKLCMFSKRNSRHHIKQTIKIWNVYLKHFPIMRVFKKFKEKGVFTSCAVFIVVFTRYHHWILSWAGWIHFMSSRPNILRLFNIILSS
jgi:hypothetical protein